MTAPSLLGRAVRGQLFTSTHTPAGPLSAEDAPQTRQKDRALAMGLPLATLLKNLSVRVKVTAQTPNSHTREQRGKDRHTHQGQKDGRGRRVRQTRKQTQAPPAAPAAHHKPSTPQGRSRATDLTKVKVNTRVTSQPEKTRDSHDFRKLETTVDTDPQRSCTSGTRYRRGQRRGRKVLEAGKPQRPDRAQQHVARFL